MGVKRTIKKVAKTTCKYTLKGVGKGAELATRIPLKVVNSISSNNVAQEIATTAGILAAGVAVPPVTVGILGATGIKFLYDKVISKDPEKNEKLLIEEVSDVLKVGSNVTRTVLDTVTPVLSGVERGIGNLGKNYQNTIDKIFDSGDER